VKLASPTGNRYTLQHIAHLNDEALERELKALREEANTIYHADPGYYAVMILPVKKARLYVAVLVEWLTRLQRQIAQAQP